MTHYLILSGILFSIGAFGVMFRRNLITILLSIEIMLNAVNLSFVTFSTIQNNLHGQVASLFVIAIAASEVAVGLALAVIFFRQKKTINTDSASDLKW